MRSHELAKFLLELPDHPIVFTDDSTCYGDTYEPMGIGVARMRDDRVVEDMRHYEKIFSTSEGYDDCLPVVQVSFRKVE